MKSKEEIQNEIRALKEIRPKVRPTSMLGDDNLAALDAQVDVLENKLDDNDIYDKYDHVDSSEYVLENALDARSWRDGASDIEHLAEDWPLKSEED